MYLSGRPRRRTVRWAGICVCLFLAACGKQQLGGGSAPSIRLESLGPSYTAQAKGFNVQPDGQAALAVVGSAIPIGSVVYWNGQRLKSRGGGAQGWVSAVIPANLYAVPGTAKITVHGPDGAVSNALEFTIYAQTGPPPAISALYPVSAVAGKGFNLQPGGDSALAISGTGFLPGVKVLFGRKEMKTSFARITSVSATIPSSIAARVGNVEVWVVNPDGKPSNKVLFKIAKE